MRLNLENPYSGTDSARFIVRWGRKLDIGDTNIFNLRDEVKGYKEIVISYKTIYINVYNIMVLD